MSLAFYSLVLTAYAVTLPDELLLPSSQKFILLLGVIGIWRYGWGGLHFIRSIVFRKLVFPAQRQRAMQLGASSNPPHVYLLLTTFRVDAESTRLTYQAAFAEAARASCPVTIVASIVEMSDQRTIKSLFEESGTPQHVRLILVRIQGSGKRDALAAGFRAISHTSPPPGSLTAVLDGDTIIAPKTIERCAPFFVLNPKLGALTTDEDNISVTRSRLYREWYHLRFAQRHILMSSMALSGRVLTLTGRLSMFRTELVTAPSFIAQVENDFIEHWRLGRFRFLTGDDKSTWHWLLQRGWQMAYIPDVRILTIEQPPHPNFFIGATKLLTRWSGNTIRTNARARRVPASTIGPFVWWALIDQRLSKWTSLFGLTLATLGAIVAGIQILYFYIFWIGLTRLMQTFMLLSARSHISALHPFLIYFNQIYGSLIKVYVASHMDRQKWTRQDTALRDMRAGLARTFRRISSGYVVATSVMTLVVGAGFVVGAFGDADLHRVVSYVGRGVH